MKKNHVIGLMQVIGDQDLLGTHFCTVFKVGTSAGGNCADNTLNYKYLIFCLLVTYKTILKG